MPAPQPTPLPQPAQEELLRRLLEQSPASARELPNLAPAEWWAAASEWLRGVVRPIIDFLKGFIPEWDGASVAVGLDPRGLGLWLVVVVAVLVAGWLGVVLLRRLQRGGGPLVVGEGDAGEAQYDRIVQGMHEARKRGDYPLAARYLWRLYLLLHRLNPSLTPLEFAQSPAAHHLKPTLADLCWLMFSGGSSSERFSTCLAALGSPPLAFPLGGSAREEEGR